MQSNPTEVLPCSCEAVAESKSWQLRPSALTEEVEWPSEKLQANSLRLPAPQVEQAIRIAERFNQLRMESEAKTAALNQLSLGVVFLAASGRILGTNEAAERLFAGNDGLSNCKGRLKASELREDRRLQAAIFQSCQTGAARGIGTGGAVLISRCPPAKPLQLIVSPACKGAAEFSSRPAAVVFVYDLCARIRPRSGVLKELYGFTPAESRLACLILDGRSSEEITALLGVSRNTLKSQMKSIFGKASVRRQSELMRLLLLLPSEAPQRRCRF